MSSRRAPGLTACFLVLVLGLCSVALAQTPEVEGVEISPARVEQDLSGRDFSLPVRIVNHETEAQRISLSVSGLGHDLDGTPLFLEPAEETGHIELSATEFVLPPGGREDVIANGSIPDDEQSLYAAVIAEFESPDAEEAEQIATRSRVASLFLFRAPRPWIETAEVVDVSMVQGPSKRDPLTVFAAVEDTGDVHIRPNGRMRIMKDGRLLDTVELGEDTILPTYARRLIGEWLPKKRPAGRFDLEVTVFNPDAEGSGFVTFTKEGEIERPGAKISNLVARDDNGPLIQFSLTNTGTIAIVPEVYVTASRASQEAAAQRLNQPLMEPGDTSLLEWRPELEEGTYAIRAEIKLEEVLLDRAVTGLRLESGGMPFWVILVGGLLLLLFVAGMALLVLRRRKKREAGEDPDKSEPAEAA